MWRIQIVLTLLWKISQAAFHIVEIINVSATKLSTLLIIWNVFATFLQLSQKIYGDFHKSFRNTPNFFREHARGARAIFHLWELCVISGGTGKNVNTDDRWQVGTKFSNENLIENLISVGLFRPKGFKKIKKIFGFLDNRVDKIQRNFENQMNSFHLIFGWHTLIDGTTLWKLYALGYFLGEYVIFLNVKFGHFSHHLKCLLCLLPPSTLAPWKKDLIENRVLKTG